MAKVLFIPNANFSLNALDTIEPSEPTYREGTIITGIWDSSGSKFLSIANYKVVAFPVTPGESYEITTDKSSSSFAFAATLPAANTPYVGGTRYVFYASDGASGVVPEGAAYLAVGMYTVDAGNLFPSSISIGDDIVDVSLYR